MAMQAQGDGPQCGLCIRWQVSHRDRIGRRYLQRARRSVAIGELLEPVVAAGGEQKGRAGKRGQHAGERPNHDTLPE